jgi:membrane protein implicated in regulation of membrane protease activity
MIKAVLPKVLLASVIATVVYGGFMWMLDDFRPKALVVFAVIVLVFNLIWHGWKARKAQAAKDVPEEKAE